MAPWSSVLKLSEAIRMMICDRHQTQKSTRSRQSCNFGKILQCWKNLGMLPSSRFWDTIFFNCVYLRVSFSVGDIIISKEEEMFGPKILMMETTIFFFVWRVGCLEAEQKPVWVETVENYPARKLELLTPQNRYIGHQCGMWKITGKIFF